MTDIEKQALALVNEVRRLLSYDPHSGLLTWRENRSGTARKGGVAGCKDGHGYIAVSILNKSYKAHRLAWLLHYGEWPEDQVDHINGNGEDNRIDNLRVVNNSVNQQNLRKAPAHNVTTKMLGVCYDRKARRHKAQIMLNGKNHHLGYHDTAEQAQAAYLEAKRKIHEGCTI